MSTAELRRMDKLRQIMRLSARGKGIAASIVETFRESKLAPEVEMVRSILLGMPVEESATRMASGDGPSRDLILYLIQQAKIDASEASRRADKLATLFEHWVRAKQERLVDQRIMETRSLMVSAILGGVTAMVATLAPVLSSFQLSFTQQATSVGYSQYLGLFFIVPGSFFLGLFFSRRRALLNVAVSVLVFSLVVYLFAPLVLSV